jgi:low affinity Fe/Cu permease
MATDEKPSAAIAPANGLPSGVTGGIGFFDHFAGMASSFASRAPFFAACVVLIVVWAPTFFLFPIDTWQLIINTATTIITFLLVALLQNSQTRSDHAIQHKLNALANGLADLMDAQATRHEDEDLRQDLIELRLAVGLEDRETTSKHDKPAR